MTFFYLALSPTFMRLIFHLGFCKATSDFLWSFICYILMIILYLISILRKANSLKTGGPIKCYQ